MSSQTRPRFCALQQLCTEAAAVESSSDAPSLLPLATVRRVSLNRRSLPAARQSGAGSETAVVVNGWSVPVTAQGFATRGDIRHVMVRSLRLQIEAGDMPYDPDFDIDSEFERCWTNTFATHDGVTETGMTTAAMRALLPAVLCHRQKVSNAARHSKLRDKALEMTGAKQQKKTKKKTVVPVKAAVPVACDDDWAPATQQWDNEFVATEWTEQAPPTWETDGW